LRWKKEIKLEKNIAKGIVADPSLLNSLEGDFFDYIRKMLKNKEFIYLGCFTNQRKKFEWDNYLFYMDIVKYPNYEKKLYEVEIEPKIGDDLIDDLQETFDEMLDTLNIDFEYSTFSKFERLE
jgi:uncharacterized protein YjbK